MRSYAGKLAADLKPGDCVLLEGPLGAGKSTFARFLIAALGGPEASAGSPTFSIAHEYATPRGEVIHVDLYRLEDEMELEAAGIESYFLERAAIVICEWASRFPQWVERVAPPTSPNSLRIQLEFVPGRPNLRKLLRF
ncbi:MAG: tRNA (adenosine(37)-N6)-threonylcarbamoyltransferase complex ATPase subunit type 1 TsaE [Bacteriovoracia bacterium]